MMIYVLKNNIDKAKNTKDSGPFNGNVSNQTLIKL